ncbi:gas vesicle protein GvpA/GvpJ/GvpM family [Micromonospora kangleipakensis]|uniref:Gas vesicle protein GvpA/GvpJ/GvpM family n=1 Tax=Micromonospora kangleipakensis TaxID=1077942 RepID=A0A4Q8B389_9ACTN|nr:gas vesicle protein GvpJ [Micromonospora kangleipakensis]RZU71964.1 gas vesicle protein GvpA/GvpJ/GvpM family [Micromonospora kangleipakensis]
MTIATSGGEAGGALERGGAASGLADVVETVLDKGVVIDAQVTIGVVGIPLVEINARVVVASIETYMKFAEMTDRLDISPKEGAGLSGLVGDVTGAARQVTAGLSDTVGEAGGAVRELGGTTGELGRTVTGEVLDATGRERPRRRRNEER